MPNEGMLPMCDQEVKQPLPALEVPIAEPCLVRAGSYVRLRPDVHFTFHVVHLISPNVCQWQLLADKYSGNQCSLCNHRSLYNQCNLRNLRNLRN